MIKNELRRRLLPAAAHARNRNLRLTDVAQAAVDGTLDPKASAPPARP